MKSIPISKIDTLIASKEKELKEADYIMDEFTDADRIKLLLWELEEIKKEAIPSHSELEPKGVSCPFCNWGKTDNEINLARHFEKEHQYKALLMLARILLGNKT